RVATVDPGADLERDARGEEPGTLDDGRPRRYPQRREPPDAGPQTRVRVADGHDASLGDDGVPSQGSEGSGQGLRTRAVEETLRRAASPTAAAGGERNQGDRQEGAGHALRPLQR